MLKLCDTQEYIQKVHKAIIMALVFLLSYSCTMAALLHILYHCFYCLFNMVLSMLNSQLDQLFRGFWIAGQINVCFLLVLISGLEYLRLPDEDDTITIQDVLCVPRQRYKKCCRIHSRSKFFWMFAVRVVQAAVSAEKLTDYLIHVCLCRTPFYRLLMIICLLCMS